MGVQAMKQRQKGRPARRTEFRRLCAAFATLRSEAEFAAFLGDLCTPAELEAMADRWRAVRLLKAGHSYRDISDETGISVTTVGRVARFLSMGNDGYETAWQRLGGSANRRTARSGP
jgi:TrpR-related protein YerC/YecD